MCDLFIVQNECCICTIPEHFLIQELRYRKYTKGMSLLALKLYHIRESCEFHSLFQTQVKLFSEEISMMIQ